MSCTDRELQIALYAGGDLPGRQAADLEHHFGGCAECRALLDDFVASRTAFAAAAEDVDEFAASAVRHRVMAKLRAPASRGFLPVFAAAFSAAVIIIAFLITPRDVARLRIVPAAPVVAQVPLPNRPAVQPVGVGTVAHVRRRSKPETVQSREPEEPVLVKLETEDPNIVIYWITD